MRLLLDDIAKRYPDRIIIFDSPPLLLTTEARVLATQVGQVVTVHDGGRVVTSARVVNPIFYDPTGARMNA